MRCSFPHANIDTLYGVKPQPIESLPKVCTCGAPLTYAPVVAFVSESGASYDRGTPTVVTEEDTVVWQKVGALLSAQPARPNVASVMSEYFKDMLGENK